MDNRSAESFKTIVCRKSSCDSCDSILTASDVSNINLYVDGVLSNEDGTEKEICDPTLKKDIVVNIMTNFRELQNNMTSSKKMAEALHNRGLISTNRLNKINEVYENNVMQSNYLLLEGVLASPMERLISERFVRVQRFLFNLKHTNQTDLLFLLLKTGSKLNRPHIKWIGQNYDFLSQNLIVDDVLLAYLTSLNVLDEYEIQDIKSHPTDHMKISCLLKLIRTKSLHCYNLFLQALNNTGQGHIAQKCDGLDSSRLSRTTDLDVIPESPDQLEEDENFERLLRKNKPGMSHSNTLQSRALRLANISLDLLQDFVYKGHEDNCILEDKDLTPTNPFAKEILETRTLRRQAADTTFKTFVDNLEKDSEEIGKQFLSLSRRGNRNGVIIPDDKK